MLDWKKHKLESRLWEKYKKPQIRRWHHPYAESEVLRIVSEKLRILKINCNFLYNFIFTLNPIMDGWLREKKWKEMTFYITGCEYNFFTCYTRKYLRVFRVFLSQDQLSEMATRSSTLAWKIPSPLAFPRTCSCYPSHGPFSIQQNAIFKRQVFCVPGIMQHFKFIISLYSYN